MALSILNLRELPDASPSEGLPAPSVPARILVTKDLRSLAGLWPRTDSAGPARCYSFQCADILEVWQDTIGAARGTQVLFVAILDAEDRPLMLLPLGIEGHRRLRVLTFLDGGVSDYNAPVVFPFTRDWDTRTIGTVWQGLRRILPPFDVAIFEKMPEYVNDLPNPLMLFDTSSFFGDGYAVNLTGIWKDFAAQRLPRVAATRRMRRRLAEIGTLKFEIAEKLEQSNIFLETMIRQKTRRYLETDGVNRFANPGYSSFFPEMTRRFWKDGPVHLSALKLDDTIIATHWGYVVGTRFYYLMPSFEGGDWQRYSPGRLLLEHLLEWSFAKGLRVFDFGSGDEAYKFDFCDLTIHLSEAVIPATLLGGVYARARAAKGQFRKIKKWRRLSGSVLKLSLRSPNRSSVEDHK